MFSNMKDPNRVIPRLRFNPFSRIMQIVLVLVVILWFAQLLLGGLLSGQLSRFIDYLYVPFLVLLLGVPLAINTFVRWNMNRKWEMLASDYSLQIERQNRFSYPVLKGTFRGHQIAVMITSKKVGRSQTYYTTFVIDLNESSQHKMTVKKRRLVSFNRESVEDEEVDKKLTISTSSDALLRRILLNSRLRQGLLELGERARSKELTLTKKRLLYVEQGQISDSEYIRAVLTYLVDLANLVERFDRMAF